MRSKVILVCEREFRENSPIVGAFDYDFILPFIRVAQDIDLAQVTGERLLKTIYEHIDTNALSKNEEHLIEEYIVPVVINYALARGLVFLQSKPDNSGLVRRHSEYGEALSMEEVSFLAEQERTIAKDYANRLRDYLEANKDKFREYEEHIAGEIKPDVKVGFTGGMVLGTNKNLCNEFANL